MKDTELYIKIVNTYNETKSVAKTAEMLVLILFEFAES